MVVAIASVITALTAMYVALSRKVEGVRVLVNSHLDEIMKALAEMTGQRDEARRALDTQTAAQLTAQKTEGQSHE